jgi:hypothetical protein
MASEPEPVAWADAGALAEFETYASWAIQRHITNFKLNGTSVPLYTEAQLLAAEQRGRDAERDTNPAREIIEQIVAGTAPMSRWMGSVDCKTYDDLEWHLQAQLRDKLYLKSAMEKSGDPNNVRDFVDGSIAAIEGMLQTLRNVAAAIRKGDAT